MTRPGRRPASSPQDLFRARTVPVTGGHLEWCGYTTNKGVPFVRWLKRGYTAGRIAFVMQYGRAPQGAVRAGCDYPGCVAPGHVEDQAMRDQLKRQLESITGAVL